MEWWSLVGIEWVRLQPLPTPQEEKSREERAKANIILLENMLARDLRGPGSIHEVINTREWWEFWK